MSFKCLLCEACVPILTDKEIKSTDKNDLLKGQS